jgi:quinol monooxygenase YgiN
VGATSRGRAAGSCRRCDLDLRPRAVQKLAMSNVVSIHPYFKTHEGKLEAFKELLPRFIAATAAEENCHWYDFTIGGDTVHCREAYEGAEGLLTHVGNVEALIGEALTISDLVRIEVHGRVSASRSHCEFRRTQDGIPGFEISIPRLWVPCAR